MKPCPPGHVLRITNSEEDEYECKCDDNNVNIVECVPNDNKIILEVGSCTHYIQMYCSYYYVVTGRSLGSLCKQWFSE